MTDTGNKIPPPLVNPREINPPLPLPDDQPPVLDLPLEALPGPIRAFVDDVSTRLQCPPDYVAVAALCGLSSVIGNKVRVCMKQHDNWEESPNLWGAVVGGPAASKSPSISAALAPLHKMESAAWKEYETKKVEYEAELKLRNIEKKHAEEDARKLSKKGNKQGAREALLATAGDIEEPKPQRFIVNDSTVEQLAVLMSQNPDGLLLVRDELTAWIAKLEKEENSSDRAFYLECHTGSTAHTTDRIGREIVRVEKMTLSIIGGIQPSKIAPLIRGAVRGSGDDGLVQRLQLAVWPDERKRVDWYDMPPNDDIYNEYAACFHRLSAIPGEGKRARFSEQAQGHFVEWWKEINTEALSDELHPVMAAHLKKMPKTVGALSLIFELIDSGETLISEQSIAMALELADYLRSHAERIYSIVGSSAIKNAKLILKRRDKLPAPFKPAQIQQKGWAGLNTKEEVYDALAVLLDHNQIKREVIANPAGERGGRPSIRFHWNTGAG